MLRLAFEKEGFVVVSTFTHMIRDGEIDVEAFARLHQPDVILYAIAPPCGSNWQLFEHVIRLTAFQGHPIVLTSTNPVRVREMAGGQQSVWEVVETPYELMALVNTVRSSIRRRRGVHADVPVVCLTAAGEEMASHAKRLGAKECLPKPAH